MPNRSFAHLSQRYPGIVEEATRFMNHEHLAGMLEGSKDTLRGPLTLSCGVPRNGSSTLSITGAEWVGTGFDSFGDFALFFPRAPSIFSPGVVVVFEPINRLARHLVEFQIQAGSSSGTQRFHIEGPMGLSEDVSITQTQLISGVVDVVPGSAGNYTVSLSQIDVNLQNASWVFRWVRVSSIA
jgi:hypothetical protein